MSAARMAAAAVGALLAVALVPGCALLSPPAAEMKKELLATMPAGVPQRTSQGAVLVVFPPQSRPLYDTTQMAYTIRPHEIAYFSQHEWAETPAQMLQPLLVGTLQNTHFFGAVLSAPFAGSHAYALRTEVRELIADFTAEPAAVRLSLRVQLSQGATGRVLAVKEISVREPMRQKTPYAGVIAANEAAAQALLELAGFVLDQAR